MSATGTNSAPALVCSPEGFKVLNTATASGLYQTLATAYNTGKGQSVRQSSFLEDGNFDADDIIDGAVSTIAGAGLRHCRRHGLVCDCQVGRIDVVIDPFSDNDKGLITLAANSYCAAGITRDAFRALAVAGATIAAS